MNSRHTDDEFKRPPRAILPSTRTSSYKDNPNNNDNNDYNNDNINEPGHLLSNSGSSRNSKAGINSNRATFDDLDGEVGSSREARIASARSPTVNNSTTNAVAPTPSPPATAFRDRPWRTTTSPGSATSPTATATISPTATAASPTSSSGLADRWAQYETGDLLIEESRKATSNAVVDMATRFADQAAHDHTDEYPKSDLGLDRLQSNGASLPTPEQHAPYNYNSRSTTDYVKGRLSTLLSPSNNTNSFRNASNSYRDNTNNSSSKNYNYNNEEETLELEYDRVRSDAIKMLQIADRVETSSSPTGMNGLFKTTGGGYAMRELDKKDASRITTSPTNHGTTKNQPSSIAGLEKYSMETRNVPRYDGTFAINSMDEEDPTSNEYGDNHNHDDANERSSSWSSRYSVERQLMAITGGLNSSALCDKMDKLHESNAKSKSARGLYRSSAAAMDGSGEDYRDYTTSSSTFGVEWGYLGGWWNSVKGTLWSDIMEANYDGTTQSLVRAERRRVKRRRILVGLVGAVGLVIAASVLAAKGNGSGGGGEVAAGAMHLSEGNGEVTFYVLSDEPYDFTNIGRLTLELETLPSDAEFLIHLGNANADKQSQCQEYGYERSANVLKESPVPVFVIPGDNDWATCQKPTKSLKMWSTNFGQFEKNFHPNPFDVSYQQDRVENFAFLHKGVLFISVHIVEAETDSYEWTTRHERNVMWTKEQLAQFSSNDYRAVVIFGHAAPSSKQGEYFWPMVDQIKDMNKPVLYLHSNNPEGGGKFQQYQPFGEADNFKAVQLEKRGEEAPMKVTVPVGGKGNIDPFLFTRREPTTI